MSPAFEHILAFTLARVSKNEQVCVACGRALLARGVERGAGSTADLRRAERPPVPTADERRTVSHTNGPRPLIFRDTQLRWPSLQDSEEKKGNTLFQSSSSSSASSSQQVCGAAFGSDGRAGESADAASGRATHGVPGAGTDGPSGARTDSSADSSAESRADARADAAPDVRAARRALAHAAAPAFPFFLTTKIQGGGAGNFSRLSSESCLSVSSPLPDRRLTPTTVAPSAAVAQPSKSSKKSDDDDSMTDSATFVVLFFGCLVGLMVLLCCYCYCRRARRRQRELFERKESWDASNFAVILPDDNLHSAIDNEAWAGVDQEPARHPANQEPGDRVLLKVNDSELMAPDAKPSWYSVYAA